MNKLQSWYRRKRLGKALKHQYQCHPNFDIQRDENSIRLFWKKKPIVTLASISSKRGSKKGSTFIVATGPSLNEIDFERLKDHDTLSLNCAIDKFDSHSMIPTQCLIVDHRIFEHHWPQVKRSILSGADCFFSAVGLSRIAEKEPSLLKKENVFLIDSFDRQFGKPRLSEKAFSEALQSPNVISSSDFSQKYRSIGFCTDASVGVFSGKTVATWAVQLQYYLGYQKQFILGMDLGGTGKHHFYTQSTNNAPDFLADYEPHIRVCFELARQAGLRNSFEIYNLSAHSTLPHEIIPKISYDAAFKIANRSG